LDALDDGLIHFHLLRLCTNSKFLYYLRGSLPVNVQAICVEIDDLVWSAFQKYQWEAPIPEGAVATDARIQFRTSTQRGGFGVAPLECASKAAFYQATSVALRSLARSEFPRVKRTLADPDFQQSPYIRAYLGAKETLLECGAIKSEVFNEIPKDDEAEDGAAQPILLPSWEELVASAVDCPLVPIPDQRDLTRLIRDSGVHTPKYDSSLISDAGRERMTHLEQVTNKDSEPDSIFDDYASIREKTAPIKHSPLLFLTHTAGTAYTNFPKRLTAAFFAHALGTKNPHAPTQPCLCGQRIAGADNTQHDLNCRLQAAYKAGHDHVVDAFDRLSFAAGIPCTTKNVPTHSTTNSVGDVHCKLSNDKRSEILDMYMTNPCSHRRTEVAKQLKAGHTMKEKKHGSAYNCHGYGRGFTFVPFVMTPLGRLHPETQRCLSHLATRMSQIEVAFRPSELPFVEVVARNTARVHSVIGASIAKGMALRVCGLASSRDSRDPPSRGWRTQMDLLEGQDWGDLGDYDMGGNRGE
jgi:hypothetical protein